MQPRQELEYDGTSNMSPSYFRDKIFDSSRRLLIFMYIGSGSSDVSIN